MSFSGKSVAVVGATGFIGSHLIDGLVASGANVLAIAEVKAEGRTSSQSMEDTSLPLVTLSARSWA